MADPRPLTREELAKFLPNQRAIRAFEKLFEIVPDDLISLLNRIEEANIDAGTALALASFAANRQNLSLDYIDFNPDPPHAEKDRRVSWSGADDTMNIHHEDGVVQQVGLETYVRFTNQTGVDIANGTVLGVNDPITPPNFIAPYLADGNTPQLNIVGVATQGS